jgi:hypothetical protein
MLSDPGPLYKVHRPDRAAGEFANRSIFPFDPPQNRKADFGTFYAATSEIGAFLEAFGNIRPLPRHLPRERVITDFVAVNSFQIADLTNEDVIRAYGDLSAYKDLRLTQNWTAALWDAGFTGVQYFPHHHSRSGQVAVALLAPPGSDHGYLKSGTPEPIKDSLLQYISSHFSIEIVDAVPLPW